MDMSKTKCAYQGLGCAKEDTCIKRGQEVMDCPYHTYFVFLDEFCAERKTNERNNG